MVWLTRIDFIIINMQLNMQLYMHCSAAAQCCTVWQIGSQDGVNISGIESQLLKVSMLMSARLNVPTGRTFSCCKCCNTAEHHSGSLNPTICTVWHHAATARAEIVEEIEQDGAAFRSSQEAAISPL
jgi:hypothetical protein